MDDYRHRKVNKKNPHFSHIHQVGIVNHIGYQEEGSINQEDFTQESVSCLSSMVSRSFLKYREYLQQDTLPSVMPFHTFGEPLRP